MNTKVMGRLETGEVLLIAIVGVGIFLRLILLGSDPVYDLWDGYVSDEGRWTEIARELVLFGAPDMDSIYSRLHLILAPAYQAVTAVSFTIFGVSFFSARLVSALCGAGILVSAFTLLRNRLSREALQFSILVLAIQPDLLFLSRVAVPETAAMLFEFLAFAMLVSRPQTAGRAFGAGLVTILAIGMKATSLFVAPILVALTAGVDSVEGTAARRQRLVSYLGGMALPVVAALALLTLVPIAGFELNLVSMFRTLIHFARIDTLQGAMSELFYPGFAAPVNFLLLPTWCIAGLLVAVGRVPSGPASGVYTGSAIWLGGWFLVWAVLLYFPERYVFHILVPLAINVGAGLTLLQTLGGRRIGAAIDAANGLKRMAIKVWFTLPLAVLISPIALAIVHLGGFDVDRFRMQFTVLLTLDLVLAGALPMRWKLSDVVFVLVVLPLVFAPLWFLGVECGVFPREFWAAGATDAGLKLALLVVAAAVAILIHHGQGWGRTPRRRTYAYLTLIALCWFARIAPGLVAPTYTIAESSAAVAAFADGSSTVGTRLAASLFLGNHLRYTESLLPGALPEVLVTAKPLPASLVEAYDVVAVREFNLGERYPAHLSFYRRRR